MEYRFDGRRAYLPMEFFQHNIFSATRRSGEEEGSVVLTKGLNWKSDQVSIWSPKTLRATPDMGVFLAVVALTQRSVIEGSYKRADAVSQCYGYAEWGMKDLYNLTRSMHGGEGPIILAQTIKMLGEMKITIRCADPCRHRNRSIIHYGPLWKTDIIPRKGPLGNLVRISPVRFLIPPFDESQESYQFAFADLCNILSSPTAKGIFWALLPREHLSAKPGQWGEIIGANNKDISRWCKTSFRPALDELVSKGYSVKEKDTGEIVIKRPPLSRMEAVMKTERIRKMEKRAGKGNVQILPEKINSMPGSATKVA